MKTRVNPTILDRVFTKMGTTKVEKALKAFDGHDGEDFGANSDWNSCFLARAGYSEASATEAFGASDMEHVIFLFDAHPRSAARLRDRAEIWLLNHLSPTGKARLFRRRSLDYFTAATQRKAKQFLARSKAQKRRHAGAARAAAKEAQVYSDAADALLAEITATAKAKQAARANAKIEQLARQHLEGVDIGMPA